jgi:hypothetical protein
MLSHVPKGKTKLPRNFLTELCEATGKSRAELSFRRQFAEEYETELQLANALANYPSWHEIVEKGLG